MKNPLASRRLLWLALQFPLSSIHTSILNSTSARSNIKRLPPQGGTAPDLLRSRLRSVNKYCAPSIKMALRILLKGKRRIPINVYHWNKEKLLGLATHSQIIRLFIAETSHGSSDSTGAERCLPRETVN
ncbi:unnamed protein product [Dovyalis caffra]|uniref:Uncharacterized protein n=1 Tax=Dovyalis caffra TaxID=77055 RepID=A0AAV1SBK4_9ROSI|nr:unnamed protein product [Dovyalis caffra]